MESENDRQDPKTLFGRAIAFLATAAVALEEADMPLLARAQLASQIRAFLDNPTAPERRDVRVMHLFKPGLLEGEAIPASVTQEDFVCESVELAWAIGMDELPPLDVRERMPPHTLCGVCFPDAEIEGPRGGLEGGAR